MDITASITPRGFPKIEFEDKSRQKCSIQRSSSANNEAIWLGVEEDSLGQKVFHRMHLTREQIKDLLPVLQKFADDGSI